MAELIDPALARRLDAYTVTALPPGFADGLVAAALEGSTPTGSELPPMRRPAARRWLRGGVTGLGAITVGMISISAAAMGYFGEPIRHAVQQAPLVGKVIERVLPRSLRAARHQAPARVAKPAPPQVQATEIAAPVLEKPAAAALTPFERRQRVRAILADPEARRAWILAHPRAAQRIARRRAEMRRRRAEAGFGPQARMPLEGPMRPLLWHDRLVPMERSERIEQLRERRQQRLERRGMLRGRGNRPFRGGP